MRLFLSLGALCLISTLATGPVRSAALVENVDDQSSEEIRDFSTVEDEVVLPEQPEETSSRRKHCSDLKTTMAERDLIPDSIQIDGYPRYVVENADESKRKKRSADNEEMRPRSIPNSQLLSNYDYDLSQEDELVSHNVPRRDLSTKDGLELVLKNKGLPLVPDVKVRRFIPNSEVIEVDGFGFPLETPELQGHSVPRRHVKDEIRGKCPCGMQEEDMETHVRVPKHVISSRKDESSVYDYADDFMNMRGFNSIPNSEPVSIEDDYIDDEIPEEANQNHLRNRRSIDDYMNDEHFLDVLTGSENEAPKKLDENIKAGSSLLKKPTVNNDSSSRTRPIRRPVPKRIGQTIPKPLSQQNGGNQNVDMSAPHFLDVLIDGDKSQPESSPKPKNKNPDYSVLRPSSMRRRNHQGADQYDQYFDASVDPRYKQVRKNSGRDFSVHSSTMKKNISTRLNDVDSDDPHFLDVLIEGDNSQPESSPKPKSNNPDYSVLRPSSMRRRNNHQGADQYNQHFDISVDPRHQQFRGKYVGRNDEGFLDLSLPKNKYVGRNGGGFLDVSLPKNKYVGRNGEGFLDLSLPKFNDQRYSMRQNVRLNNNANDFYNRGRAQQNHGQFYPSQRTSPENFPSDENFLSVLVDPSKGYDDSQDYNRFELKRKYGNRQRDYSDHQHSHGLGRIPPNLHAKGDYGEEGVEYIQGIPVPHGFHSQSSARRHYEDNNRRRYPSNNLNFEVQNGENEYNLKFKDDRAGRNMNFVFDGINSLSDRGRQYLNNLNVNRRSFTNGFMHPDLLTRLQMKHGNKLNGDQQSNAQSQIDFHFPTGDEEINVKSGLSTNIFGNNQAEEGNKRNGGHSSLKFGPLSLQLGVGN